MNVTIYTSKNKLIDHIEANSVSIPGKLGMMQILNNHIPVITTLKEGVIVVEPTSGDKISVEVSHGFMQFAKNEMIIVVEKTSLTYDQLKEIEMRAEKRKDYDIRRDNDVTEDEFEHTHHSLKED